MKIRNHKTSLAKALKSELKMAWEYVRGNIASAAELRFSFITQIVGMMFNNITFLVIWIFFFNAFGSINGWSGKEVVALQGFVAVVYGISFSLCTGVLQLPTAINNGVFDSVLLTPRNLYLRILTLSTQASAIGDTLYGLLVLCVYIFIAHISALQIVLLFFLLIPAAVITINFALITSCIGFFLPDADDISKNAFEIMFGPSLYPAGVYQGIVRFIFLFILPAIAVAGLPIEAVKNLNGIDIVIIWSLAIFWTLAAVFILNLGIKRYESGNLTGARI